GEQSRPGSSEPMIAALSLVGPESPSAIQPRPLVSSTETKQLIRVGHSPDPDDAFMFHALANECIETEGYHFTHELVDIEMLNQRAFTGELELTAVSIHAYAFLHDKYLLCSCGASMGDGYGPMVVARDECSVEDLKTRTIAVPGKLTSAFLSLRMCLGEDFDYVLVPFDEILNAVEAGEYDGKKIEAGLIIHEGQLTYGDQDLKLIVDLGIWWGELTGGLPLPLGANAIRKDLGEAVINDVQKLLHESIDYGLKNRQEALDYALQYGRDLDNAKADKFVGMYVNDWTLDFGPKGRESVAKFLAMGHEQGILPELVVPEFVDL
ncbi:MAG: MqnA/MqnD/SBP family protein, partial [Lacipirellulaceae bacterium]